MFSDLGLRSLVLTKEEPVEEDFLRTCWTVSILRGLAILAFSTALGAGILGLQVAGLFPDSSAYSAPELPLALAALGTVSFFKGFQSANLFLAERGMMFGRITLLQIAVNLLSLIVTIAAAVYLRSVWALVLGAVVQAALQVAFSFLLFPGASMRPALKRDSFELIYTRGKWILGHSVLTALSLSADRMVLGFFMTSSAFGYYVIARQIVDLFMRFMESLHGQMGLQVFTQILRDDVVTFRRKYYQYRFFFDAISGLSAGGLLVLGPTIVTIVFDDRYQPVAPLVQILCLGLLVRGPLTLRDAFSAQRKFKDMTVLSVVSTLSIWCGIGLSLLVLQSVPAALFCIAFYRLPEAILLWLKGHSQGWIAPVREAMPLIFLLVGCGLAWSVLQAWNFIA
jgi:O-antigen/teichoic acid export membrane protein